MSAGKGSKPRPVDLAKYQANYDAIFRRKYPDWVCRPCGWQYGRFPKMDRISAWHEGTCGICGQRGPVSEPRDFGHLQNLPTENCQLPTFL